MKRRHSLGNGFPPRYGGGDVWHITRNYSILERNMEHPFSHLEQCGFSLDELTAAGAGVPATVAFPKGFLELPEDAEHLARITAAAREKQSGNLAGVIICGIGGSSLGATAVAQALGTVRPILFAETTDPMRMRGLEADVKTAAAMSKHYLLVAVSRSGSTTETIANFAVLQSVLKASDPQWREHIVAVTDEDSALWRYAKDQGFAALAMAPGIEGRFSLFSASALFPLAVAGVDISALARGAALVLPSCLDRTHPDANPALLHAAAAHLNAQKGKNIHTMFLFAPALAGLGAWWSQLVGETLGKQGKGMMPVVSIGSSDLHTLGQRYFDGPKDVFTTFVSAKRFENDIAVPSDQGIAALVPDIESKTLGGILNTIYQGVKTSYQAHGLPYAEHTLENISAENVGALMQTLMIEIITTAHLLGVDPYTQPAVESYKEEVRKLLGQ